MVRLIILLLFCLSANAQVSTMRLYGESFTFVGDSFSEFRSPGDYSSIDENDLNSYLRLFVRDAIVTGLDLGLDITNNRDQVSLYRRQTGVRINVLNNSVNLVDEEFYGSYTVTSTTGPDRTYRVGGSSWRDGWREFIITVNRHVWNTIDSSKKRQLMYHEFGHALLHRAHDCVKTNKWYYNNSTDWGRVEYRAIMYTGACSRSTTITEICHPYIEEYVTTGCSGVNSGYDFSRWEDKVRHIHNSRNLLPWPRLRYSSSKAQPTPIDD